MRRAALGDSPDTSKALRSLVAAGLVQREGRGGRSDTFRYKARSLKLDSLLRVAQGIMIKWACYHWRYTAEWSHFDVVLYKASWASFFEISSLLAIIC